MIKDLIIFREREGASEREIRFNKIRSNLNLIIIVKGRKSERERERGNWIEIVVDVLKCRG